MKIAYEEKMLILGLYHSGEKWSCRFLKGTISA